MNDDPDGLLLALALLFTPLSLSAFGGGISVLPEIQRQVVNVHGWATETQFLSLGLLVSSSPGLVAIAAASTAACLLRPNLHPIAVIGCGSLVYLALIVLSDVSLVGL